MVPVAFYLMSNVEFSGQLTDHLGDGFSRITEICTSFTFVVFWGSNIPYREFLLSHPIPTALRF